MHLARCLATDEGGGAERNELALSRSKTAHIGSNASHMGELGSSLEQTCVCAQLASVVSNSVTPWTVARQAPLSMRLCRQKYWSGLPCTPPGNLPNPGIKPRSPAMAGDSFNTEPPGKPCNKHPYCHPKSRRPGQMMQRASTLGSFHLTSRSLICAM